MTNLKIPESTSAPTGVSESTRASGPKMKGNEKEKKRYVGLSYTETQHRQLYLAATHRNKSPGDYIWDIIYDHVQADLAELQRDLDRLIR
ncbi:MAG: hypothetical protein OXC95_11575 [Dehalococcoidia bacterium]|nr:hypothetical protein [Dehalococcoidia bacterium]